MLGKWTINHNKIQVIAKLEGPAVSQYCALRLLQVGLLIL